MGCLKELSDLIKKDTLVTVYRIILGIRKEETNQNTETSLENNYSKSGGNEVTLMVPYWW